MQINGTSFDQTTYQLLVSSQKDRKQADKALARAAQRVDKAGDDGLQAAANLLGAGVNVSNVAIKTVGGTVVGVGGAAVHTTLGTAAATAGVVLEGGNVVRVAGKESIGFIGKVFVKLGDALMRVSGTGHVTVEDIEKGSTGGKRLGQKLFSVAGKQYGKAGQDLKVAGKSYVEAMEHALGAGVNIATAAGFAAATAGDLAIAAAHSGRAGAEIAEQHLKVIAAISAQVGENTIQASAEGMIAAARATTAVSNWLADPSQGEDEIKVIVERSMNDKSFRELYDAAARNVN